MYVVREEHAGSACVAALCTGKAVESTAAQRNQLTFQMKVEGRVSENTSTNASLSFSLVATVKQRDPDGPKRLAAPYVTSTTTGTISMER